MSVDWIGKYSTSNQILKLWLAGPKIQRVGKSVKHGLHHRAFGLTLKWFALHDDQQDVSQFQAGLRQFASSVMPGLTCSVVAPWLFHLSDHHNLNVCGVLFLSNIVKVWTLMTKVLPWTKLWKIMSRFNKPSNVFQREKMRRWLECYTLVWVACSLMAPETWTIILLISCSEP